MAIVTQIVLLMGIPPTTQIAFASQLPHTVAGLT
jgi:hypothetical protein